MARRQEMDPQFGSFDEYYECYLEERRHPWSRRVQFLGTSVAIGFVASSLLGAAAASLAPAWVSERMLEGKSRRTSRNVAWRLRADILLWTEMVQKMLGGRVARAMPLTVVDSVASTLGAAWPGSSTSETAPDDPSEPSARATSPEPTSEGLGWRSVPSTGWAMWE